MRFSKSTVVAAVAVLSSSSDFWATVEAKKGRILSRRHLLAKKIQEQDAIIKNDDPKEKKSEINPDFVSPLWVSEEEDAVEENKQEEEQPILSLWAAGEEPQEDTIAAPDVGILAAPAAQAHRALAEDGFYFNSCPPSATDFTLGYDCDCGNFNNSAGTGSMKCTTEEECEDGECTVVTYDFTVTGPADYSSVASVLVTSETDASQSFGYTYNVVNGEVQSCTSMVNGCACTCTLVKCSDSSDTDFKVECPGIDPLDFCGDSDIDYLALDATCDSSSAMGVRPALGASTMSGLIVVIGALGAMMV